MWISHHANNTINYSTVYGEVYLYLTVNMPFFENNGILSAQLQSGLCFCFWVSVKALITWTEPKLYQYTTQYIFQWLYWVCVFSRCCLKWLLVNNDLIQQTHINDIICSLWGQDFQDRIVFHTTLWLRIKKFEQYSNCYVVYLLVIYLMNLIITWLQEFHLDYSYIIMQMQCD